MTSAVVRRHWETEGLLPLAEERARGVVPSEAVWRGRLENADLLSLASLADWVRERECGADVTVYIPAPPRAAQGVHVVTGDNAGPGGTRLMREVALLRLLGPMGLRIVYDWGSLGLDLAPIVLDFGASDLAGPIAVPHALPSQRREDEPAPATRTEPALATRTGPSEARVAALVEGIGRRPVFVGTQAPSSRGTPRHAPTETVT